MFSLEQYELIHEHAGIFDRRDRGRLRLTGQDRRAYLQGLLTNDIVALSAGSSCYAAMLTPQGRMISDMRVSELGGEVLIDLPGHTAESVRQRLADFVFSEDVEVTDLGDVLVHVGLYGPRAAGILATVAGGQAGARREELDRLPMDRHTTVELSGAELLAIRSRDFGVPGFELFLEASRLDTLMSSLAAGGAGQVSIEAVEVCRIEGGVPLFGVDMDEHTIPLEAGIEDRAVSTSKGCYVGQEIVIRVLHRGHGRVAKRLVGFIGAGDDEPFERGDTLMAGDGAKEVGSVTSATFSPRLRRPIGLGYVHRDFAEPGAILQLGSSSAPPARQVTVVTVPFIQPAA